MEWVLCVATLHLQVWTTLVPPRDLAKMSSGSIVIVIIVIMITCASAWT